MITRYVFLKFKAAYSSAEWREEAAQMARAIVPTVPVVRRVVVSVPADRDAERAWDLGLTLEFERLEDIDVFRAHAVHREYVDDYIRPKVEVMKTWNFVVEE